jgi:hypothetical protein
MCGAVRLVFRRLVAGHFYRWLNMSKPTDLLQEINSLFRVVSVTKLLNSKNLCRQIHETAARGAIGGNARSRRGVKAVPSERKSEKFKKSRILSPVGSSLTIR